MDLPVAVEESVGDVLEHARIFRGEVSASDLVQALLQLRIVVVEVSSVVAAKRTIRFTNFKIKFGQQLKFRCQVKINLILDQKRSKMSQHLWQRKKTRAAIILKFCDVKR